MSEIMAQYAAAFNKHYPTYAVTFERAKKTPDGAARYHVVLNGDKGNLPMTMADMEEATRNFNR